MTNQQEPQLGEIENLYAASEAAVRDPVAALRVPERILKPLQQAVIAGYLLAFLLVFSMLPAVQRGVPDAWWVLFDVAIIAGLTFGVQYKSRGCALGLLLFTTWIFILHTLVKQRASVVVMGAVFVALFIKGFVATLDYHRFIRKMASIVQPGAV